MDGGAPLVLFETCARRSIGIIITFPRGTCCSLSVLDACCGWEKQGSNFWCYLPPHCFAHTYGPKFLQRLNIGNTLIIFLAILSNEKIAVKKSGHEMAPGVELKCKFWNCYNIFFIVLFNIPIILAIQQYPFSSLFTLGVSSVGLPRSKHKYLESPVNWWISPSSKKAEINWPLLLWGWIAIGGNNNNFFVLHLAYYSAHMQHCFPPTGQRRAALCVVRIYSRSENNFSISQCIQVENSLCELQQHTHIRLLAQPASQPAAFPRSLSFPNDVAARVAGELPGLENTRGHVI